MITSRFNKWFQDHNITILYIKYNTNFCTHEITTSDGLFAVTNCGKLKRKTDTDWVTVDTQC